MEEFTMTYDEALKVLESCNGETMKAAAQTACKALRAEIGRGHRFASDLESAETDYVRDIAYDQDLEGEDADSFFGKVKADGFDLMDAFHDGAEWQREREHDGMTLEDFCHVKYMLEDILERNMERSEVVKITQELHTQAFNVGLFKSKKAVWHTLDEKADSSKYVVLYDVAGGYMSPPSRCMLGFDSYFINAMNKRYGANYTMWAYKDDLVNLSNVERIEKDWKEGPVSEDFEDAANNALERMLDKYGLVGTGICLEMFKLGAKWKKENLWKPADGDDLPEIDREVIVFVKYMEYPTYRVEFGHRPNPNGWDGKSIATGKVEHYTPKTYDKGGWNIPDIVYWLDVELPKETEL